MYEDLKEYLNWYDTRRDVKFAKDAPIIGLVLQRSHLVTGDEGHYSGVVSELEAQGAKASIAPFSADPSDNARQSWAVHKCQIRADHCRRQMNPKEMVTGFCPQHGVSQQSALHSPAAIQGNCLQIITGMVFLGQPGCCR